MNVNGSSIGTLGHIIEAWRWVHCDRLRHDDLRDQTVIRQPVWINRYCCHARRLAARTSFTGTIRAGEITASGVTGTISTGQLVKGSTGATAVITGVASPWAVSGVLTSGAMTANVPLCVYTSGPVIRAMLAWSLLDNVERCTRCLAARQVHDRGVDRTDRALRDQANDHDRQFDLEELQRLPEHHL